MVYDSRSPGRRTASTHSIIGIDDEPFSDASEDILWPPPQFPDETTFSTTRNFEGGLHLATRNGHIYVVRMLLEHGVNVNDRDGLGRTALHEAVRGRQMEIVALLLEKGADANAADLTGWTPTHYACKEGLSQCLNLLLMHGANADLKTNYPQSP